VTQGEISDLENGELPTSMRGGYAKIDAVLAAYEWRKSDRAFMRHMIAEFARIE